LDEQAESLFSIPVRVYIEDTDAGGIVFYANYLKYFERARTEFFRSRGIELRQCFSQNINYVVHSLSIQYKKPALLDECLQVSARPVKLGRTFVVFVQQVHNAKAQCLVDAEVKIACLALNSGKPRHLPDEVVSFLSAGMLKADQ
jgi:tol-pal system-associated acyl-CoA thioesterase